MYISCRHTVPSTSDTGAPSWISAMRVNAKLLTLAAETDTSGTSTPKAFKRGGARLTSSPNPNANPQADATARPYAYIIYLIQLYPSNASIPMYST